MGILIRFWQTVKPSFMLEFAGTVLAREEKSSGPRHWRSSTRHRVRLPTSDRRRRRRWFRTSKRESESCRRDVDHHRRRAYCER